MNLIFRESRTVDLDRLVKDLQSLAGKEKQRETLFVDMLKSVDLLIT
jgi:hypothetical protein